MCACTSWNIGPCKIYNTRLQWRNMEDKEHAYHDAYFQRELDSLKLNMVDITDLLE
jgi:hypothetical protein